MAVVTTVGGSLATSFITAAEADTILQSAPFDASGWMELSTGGKEDRLLMAAQMMGYLPWRGYRVYTNQALCWPRTIQDDTAVVPDLIKRTQAYLAWLVIHRGLVSISDPGQGVDSPEIKSLSLGGFLGVTFATGSQVSASSVLKFIAAADFPVYLACGEYLTAWRSIGDGQRPDLEDQVD